MKDYSWIVAMAAVMLASLTPTVKAQSCQNAVGVSVRYDEQCRLEGTLLTTPFVSCGAPSPGHLYLAVYRDLPSSQGGILIAGLAWTPCDCWQSPTCTWIGAAILPALPANTVLWVEVWLDGASPEPDIRCTNWAPIRVDYFNGTLGEPSGVQASPMCGGIQLTWDVVTNATIYDILRSLTPVLASASQIGSTASPNYLDASAIVGEQYHYWVRARNACTSRTTSDPATAVRNAATPVVTVQPSSQTRCVGDSAMLVCAASGSPAPTFQWRRNSSPIADATGSSYSIDPVVAASAGSYDCVATNTCGAAVTAPASLTVKSPPVITAQPVSLARCIGESATFTITASGSSPLLYQWRKNGANIPNATASSYLIASVTPANAGAYDCVVLGASPCGYETSSPATLDVYCNCPGPSSTLHGINDNFVLPAEPASPRPALSAAGQNYFGLGIPIDFDPLPGPGGSGRRLFADSFAIPSNILGATLTLHVGAGQSSGGQGQTSDDEVWLGVADATTNGGIPSFWHDDLGTLTDVPWNTGTRATLSLDLSALPTIGGGTVLAQIISSGFLDILVENKTGVDYAMLALTVPSSPAFPWIALHPRDAQVCSGGQAIFTTTVNAAGAPHSFQWRKDGTPLTNGPTVCGSIISGATTSILTISSICAADPGSYDCIVSNACGSVTSDPATLTVGGGCLADYNCDGFVDGIDSDQFNNDFESQDPQQQIRADINGDGFVDGIDYDLFNNAFEAGC